MGEGQQEEILAECARSRRCAVRRAAVTVGLLAVLLSAALFAVTTRRYYGMTVFLVPVLLVMNLLMLSRYTVAIRKIHITERLVRRAPSGSDASECGSLSVLVWVCGGRAQVGYRLGRAANDETIKVGLSRG